MHPERDSHDASSSRDAGACISLIVPSRYPNTRPISAPTEYGSSVKRLCQTVVEALPASFGRGSEEPGRPHTPRDPRKRGDTLRLGERAKNRCRCSPSVRNRARTGATALADRLHLSVGALSPARSVPSTEVQPRVHWPMGSALAIVTPPTERLVCVASNRPTAGPGDASARGSCARPRGDCGTQPANFG